MPDITTRTRCPGCRERYTPGTRHACAQLAAPRGVSRADGPLPGTAETQPGPMAQWVENHVLDVRVEQVTITGKELREAEVLPYAESLAKARQQDDLTRELMATADTIYQVAKSAGSRMTAIDCPHGNLPAYPTHAVWCDECWAALGEALAKAGAR